VPLFGESPTLSSEPRRRFAKGDCLRRSPSVWLSVCSAAIALLAAGCGGDESASQAPELRPVVAERLAARSDAIADAIERNDGCSARRDLERLGAELRASDVPAAIRREAQRVLAGTQVVCPERQPPPVTQPAEEEDDEGDGNGKNKAKKKDKKDKKGKKGKKKGHDDEDDD
jgi:hypothetical protein